MNEKTEHITREAIERLGELARIEVAPDDATALASEIEGILGYVGELRELDLDDATAPEGAVENVMREDVVTTPAGVYTEALLSLVPRREGNYVVVKKILQQ